MVVVVVVVLVLVAVVVVVVLVVVVVVDVVVLCFMPSMREYKTCIGDQIRARPKVVCGLDSPGICPSSKSSTQPEQQQQYQRRT